MKCPECGARLWKMEGSCPKCGAELAPGDKNSDKTKDKKAGTDAPVKLDKGGSSEKTEKAGKAEKTEKSEKAEKTEKGIRRVLPIKLGKDRNEKPSRRRKKTNDSGAEDDPSAESSGKGEKRGLFGKFGGSAGKEKENDGGAVVKKGLNVKVLLVIAAVVVIAVIILVAVLNYRSGKGERSAEKAYEYIGRDIRSLNDAMAGEMYYSDSSQYAGVNNAVAFDYIAESESSVKAGGVKYPKWAVTIKNDKSGGFITSVTYTDFSVVKSDMRGEKTDGLINLDKFAEGEKKSNVLREIDPSPYSISCSQTGIILYTYKYWYKQDNGDEQAVILRVGFSEKGDYKYSATEIIIPPNM